MTRRHRDNQGYEQASAARGRQRAHLPPPASTQVNWDVVLVRFRAMMRKLYR